jgi:hypothetical protein
MRCPPLSGEPSAERPRPEAPALLPVHLQARICASVLREDLNRRKWLVVLPLATGGLRLPVTGFDRYCLAARSGRLRISGE